MRAYKYKNGVEFNADKRDFFGGDLSSLRSFIFFPKHTVLDTGYLFFLTQTYI